MTSNNLYCEVASFIPRRLSARPDWRDDAGEPVSDAVLIAHGVYPVLDEPPTVAALTEYAVRRPVEEWEIAGAMVRATYTTLAYTPDELWQRLRAERNRLLAESDKSVMPDRWEAMPPERRAAWAGYRQALRDLPETTADPAAPVWPEPPA